MTIKTYDDIQHFGLAASMFPGDVKAGDLRREAEVLDSVGTGYELWRAGAYNSEGLEVLWVPSAGRAGVAWGGDAAWTDADSAEDALERYFGVDGKEMCE